MGQGLGSCWKLHMSLDTSAGRGVILGPILSWLASLRTGWGSWLLVVLGTHQGRGRVWLVSHWSWSADHGLPSLQPLIGILTMPAL